MDARIYLEQEVEKLKTELSVTIPQEIQDAIESGDLRENTEYFAALARQNFVSIRLQQLLERLEAYKNIDYSKLPKDAINIGSIVKLRDLKTNKMFQVKIVVDLDDSSDMNEITINSPMGVALRNKKIKEEVSVPLPKGKAVYRILQIKTIHDLT